ncbi:winged helix-turn-helix transcriptional regulator [Halalkalicoccus jeotgali]|uniref:HoxA-like transcriptional regulator n=1 Tax=Halalkalicoccus jeotgali (strain DSM 18796 / CECT 7217 / JCM 14584 / KCTC 4019 / B3) TaxID=795797 RepID=D8J5R1_HALJB|nr:winged helix-turn-helix transcriptional regulator [Halalkalicoccus jeotgali]ADJ13717.1 HoxA-like transcriptional regulator [Halalkalicoccus jeotgali B3]ELY34236.1 HoxA-like transcriptional regulator [Halalkalicoccus jeotgali B3]
MTSNTDRAQRVVDTVDLISKKWHPVIIQRLLEAEPLRFNELKERIDGISGKVLTDSLEDLTESGLLSRTVVSEAPKRVEYELTDTGHELQDALEALAAWGDRHLDPDPDPVVLIVDDDPRLVRMHASWLESDYTVERAYDGEDAFKKLDDSIDAVLLDRRMPGIDGEDVLARIREWNLDCGVIMLSAVEPDFDIVDMGFDAYIVKPGFRDEVRETVTDVLARDVHDAPLREYLALSAKESLLRAEKSAAELEASDEYDRLRRRIERLASQLDDPADAADDPQLQALLNDA